MIFNSTKKYPTIITGNEETKILKKRILFSKKSIMSLRKQNKTAKNDPMCKLTSIDNIRFSKLSFSEIKIKCEDELTGKNSVIP